MTGICVQEPQVTVDSQANGKVSDFPSNKSVHRSEHRYHIPSVSCPIGGSFVNILPAVSKCLKGSRQIDCWPSTIRTYKIHYSVRFIIWSTFKSRSRTLGDECKWDNLRHQTAFFLVKCSIEAIQEAVLRNKHDLIKLFIEMRRIDEFIPLTYNKQFA